MMKRNGIKVSVIALMLASAAIAKANNFSVHLQGGVSIANFGNTQNIWWDSNIENQYVTSDKTTYSPYAGLGVAYQWDQLFSKLPKLAFNLGLTAYYEKNNLSGISYPFINAGSYATSDYKLQEKSRAIMLEPKFIYTAFTWQPYFMFGIGQSANQSVNYTESPSDPNSSAVPMTYPYQDKTYTNFAYEVGVGVQHEIFSKPQAKLLWAAEYRYMNWGKMGLSTYPGQQTDSGPSFGQLKTNLVGLNLIWQF